MWLGIILSILKVNQFDTICLPWCEEEFGNTSRVVHANVKVCLWGNNKNKYFFIKEVWNYAC